MTLAYSYVTKLPQVNVSELKRLQWAIEIAQKDYAKAAVNTALAWKMHDDAIEDGNKQAVKDCTELAGFCEFIQREAFRYLENLKRDLLAINN